MFGNHTLVNGHISKKSTPPRMVERKSRAPFLFKFCRVVYDKENKRLDIQDGEFVGSTVRSHRGLTRSDVAISDEEAVLYLEMDETQGIIIKHNQNCACLAFVSLGKNTGQTTRYSISYELDSDLLPVLGQ